MLNIDRNGDRNYGVLDRVGMTASFLCAIHCAAMPLLVGLLPLIGLGLLAEEGAEWTLVGFSIALGLFSLLPGYFRKHRRSNALIVFTAGVALILTGRIFCEENSGLELPAVVAGALFIAAAHLINRKLCRSCPLCVDQGRRN